MCVSRVLYFCMGEEIYIWGEFCVAPVRVVFGGIVGEGKRFVYGSYVGIIKDSALD